MLLVTGATGYVGRRALRLLAQQGHPVAALVRDPERARQLGLPREALRVAGYDDAERLRRAFAGISGLLFVASDGDGRRVMPQHATVIDAAAAAGVGRIVFTTIIDTEATSPFYYAPVYRDTERRLAESGIPYSLVRCGLYADLVLSHWVEPAFATGELALSAGAAKIAPVARDDVAVAAAAALASGRTGEAHVLTGPRAHDFAEVAALASRAFGRPLSYRPCGAPAYLKHAWATMEDPWPHAFSTLLMSIAEGRYARVQPGVQTLTGHAPQDLATFFERAAAQRRSATATGSKSQ
jgi:NAD(P)H dehydrogenase (quinone)